MDIQADFDWANIQKMVDNLAVLGKRRDEAFKAQEFGHWMLIDAEYKKARDQALSAFKSLGKTEEDLDRVETQTIARLRQK